MRNFFSDFSPFGKIVLLLIALGFLGLVAGFIRDMVHPPPPQAPPTCERAVERSVAHCIKPMNGRERDMECMDKGKEMLKACNESAIESR
jgi:hypothetical protein